jgi:hypothetical protein
MVLYKYLLSVQDSESVMAGELGNQSLWFRGWSCMNGYQLALVEHEKAI